MEFLLEKSSKKKKTISINVEMEKILINLSKKYEITQSRIIEIAIKRLCNEIKEDGSKINK